MKLAICQIHAISGYHTNSSILLGVRCLAFSLHGPSILLPSLSMAYKSRLVNLHPVESWVFLQFCLNFVTIQKSIYIPVRRQAFESAPWVSIKYIIWITKVTVCNKWHTFGGQFFIRNEIKFLVSVSRYHPRFKGLFCNISKWRQQEEDKVDHIWQDYFHIVLKWHRLHSWHHPFVLIA